MTCCNLSPSSRSFVGEWKCGRESIKVYEKGRALVRGKRAIWGYLTEDVISIEYKENGESKAVELRATERWTDREESTVAVINWDEPEVGCEKVSEGEKGTAKAGL